MVEKLGLQDGGRIRSEPYMRNTERMKGIPNMDILDAWMETGVQGKCITWRFGGS